MATIPAPEAIEDFARLRRKLAEVIDRGQANVARDLIAEGNEYMRALSAVKHRPEDAKAYAHAGAAFCELVERISVPDVAPKWHQAAESYRAFLAA